MKVLINPGIVRDVISDRNWPEVAKDLEGYGSFNAYPFAGRASYILASLYLRRNYGSIFRSAQYLQLRTARRLVKDLTRSISAALRPAKGYALVLDDSPGR